MSKISILLFVVLIPANLLGKNIPCMQMEASLTDVCTVCACSNVTIDCRSRQLVMDLASFAWPDWQNAEAWLDDNFITHVTHYPGSPIIKLSLTSNRISGIDDGAFQDLQKLQELDLSDNQLTSGSLKPEAFQGVYDRELYLPMKALKILNLSYNKLDSLQQDLFRHIPNLEVLILNHNPIRTIGDSTRMSLSSIPYIKVLDLSYTGISELPEFLLHGSSFLKELNLKGNYLIQVPHQFVADNHDLTHINLDENPIAEAAVTT